jgi:hypothetical protein
MTLPPISPTGALASGDYVDYMISYNNLAEDELSTELDGYITQSTIDDWHRLWDRVLADTSANVTTLKVANNDGKGRYQQNVNKLRQIKNGGTS